MPLPLTLTLTLTLIFALTLTLAVAFDGNRKIIAGQKGEDSAHVRGADTTSGCTGPYPRVVHQGTAPDEAPGQKHDAVAGCKYGGPHRGRPGLVGERGTSSDRT